MSCEYTTKFDGTMLASNSFDQSSKIGTNADSPQNEIGELSMLFAKESAKKAPVLHNNSVNINNKNKSSSCRENSTDIGNNYNIDSMDSTWSSSILSSIATLNSSTHIGTSSGYITDIDSRSDHDDDSTTFGKNNANWNSWHAKNECQTCQLHQLQVENKQLRQQVLRLNNDRVELLNMYSRHIEEMENKFNKKIAVLEAKIDASNKQQETEQVMYSGMLCERDETISYLELAISRLQEKLYLQADQLCENDTDN